MPDWLTTFLGAALLVFGFFGAIYGLYKFLKRTILKPKLRLEFDKTKTFEEKRVEGTKYNLVWVHILVTHNSSKPLKECTAYLTEVSKLEGNEKGNSLPDFQLKLPLHWAHTGHAYKVDILRGESQKLDLFEVHRDHKLLVICTGQEPAGTKKIFEAGDYYFKIECTSEGAKPASIELKVQYSEDKELPIITPIN